MQLSYERIKQILVIVKNMSLSKAAKELFISQPALSVALSRFENEIGIKLFYRDGNKLILSAEGEALLPYFTKIRDDCDEFVEVTHTLQGMEQNEIRVGFSGSPMFFNSLYLTDFLSIYENRPIKKYFTDEDQLISMLKLGKIDFAISTPALKDDHISSIILATEPIGIAVANQHPLAKKESVSLKELIRTPFVSMNRQHLFRHTCDVLCMENGFTPKYIGESEYHNYNRMIEEYVGAGRAAAFCAREMYPTIFGEGYTYIPLQETNMCRMTTLSYLANSKVPYQMKDLFDQIIRDFPAQYQYHTRLRARIRKEEI